MRYLSLLFAIFVFAPNSFAAPKKAYFYQDIIGAKDLFSAKVSDSFLVSVNTPEGVHRIKLTRVKNRDYKARVDGKKANRSLKRPKLFRGKVLKKRNRKSSIDGVGANIFNGKLRINFFGNQKRIYSISVYEDKDLSYGRLTHAPQYLKLGCGTSELNTSSLVNDTQETYSELTSQAVFTPGYIAELGTDSDSKFYFQMGGSVSATNAEVESIVNDVNAIYASDIGLEFDISSQNVFTSSDSEPYNSTDVGVLLDTFVEYTNSNNHISGDVKHLFTSRNTVSGGDDGVVGLAYVGVVCDAPEFSYGLSETNFPSVTHLIAAHEIGHNFNAVHVSSGLMGATLNSSNDSFSTTSIGHITSHITNNNSCLVEDSSINLRVRRWRKKFRAKFTPVIDMSSCQIDLYADRSSSDLSGTYENATLVKSITGGVANVEIQEIAKGLTRSSSKRIRFRAVATCGSEVFESPIKRIKRESGNGTLVNAKKFLNHLKNKY